MARHDNTYSRLVAWLKILLPVVALGILSTLFLLPRQLEVERVVRLGRAEGPAGVGLMRQPAYAGVTRDGVAVAVVAETARPDPQDPDVVIADAPRARFEMPGGDTTEVAARTGALDTEAEVLIMTGDVRIDTSDGYRMRTEGLTAHLDRTRIASQNEVRTTGPLGELNAGNMLITRGNGTNDPYLMVFGGGVHLIYHP